MTKIDLGFAETGLPNWEHTIRDEKYLSLHADYIHYNSAKHKHVKNAIDYKYSSFKSFVEQGFYPFNWSSNIELGDMGNRSWDSIIMYPYTINENMIL